MNLINGDAQNETRNQRKTRAKTIHQYFFNCTSYDIFDKSMKIQRTLPAFFKACLKIFKHINM